MTPRSGVVMVRLYTDFKLHDICRLADDPNREVLNQNAAAGSESFFQGNPKFLTRRLWTVGSKPNYFHHGQFTTIREAILNHFGEALPSQAPLIILITLSIFMRLERSVALCPPAVIHTLFKQLLTIQLVTPFALIALPMYYLV